MKKVKKALCMALSIACAFTATSCKSNKKTGDVATVKWYTLGTKQVDQNKVMEALNEKLAEKYKLNLDFQPIDAGAYNDKMNMIISSGEDFDLCFTSNWTNNFPNGVSKNAYIPLDDYLKGDRKKLYDSLPNFTWDDTKINGKIMSVPNYQSYYMRPSVFIPTKYVEKYNFDVSKIKSVFDLEPILKTLKENEKDISPIMPQDFAGSTYVPSSYYDKCEKYANLMDVPFLTVDMNYKAHCIYELDEFKTELALYRDWYLKGYTRKDILSAVNSKEDDLTALKYGVWFGSWSPTTEGDAIKKYGEKVSVIPISDPYILHNMGQATMTAVSRTSKQPNEALKLLEVMFTDKDAFNLLCYGIENEHYKKVTDKTIKLIDNGQKYNLGSNAWAYGNLFNSYCTGETKEESYTEAMKINESAVRSHIRGFSIDLSNITTEMAKVTSVKSEYDYMVLGADDYEPILKECVKKMKAAGLDDIKAEIQSQLDEFVKNK